MAIKPKMASPHQAGGFLTKQNPRIGVGDVYGSSWEILKMRKLTSQLFILLFVAFAALLADKLNAQTATEKPDDIQCSLDLNLPGKMSDIASNALLRKFKKDHSKVRAYLDVAQEKYNSGLELAEAAAKEFGIEESTFLKAIEEYRHVNCTHVGGGEYGSATATSAPAAKQQAKLTTFSEHVLTHVVLHEVGHALIREFDLPVLGNEETAADAFATHYAVKYLPDDALEILTSRIQSLMIEADEVPRSEWPVTGEHDSDARRAYHVAALSIAFDATKYRSLATLVGMTESEVSKARDYGTEIHRSWRRILRPLWMPDGQLSNEARVRVADNSIYSSALSQSELVAQIRTMMKSFDWHSQVTVSFSGGDGGASWSRSKRTVSVKDGYIQRFVRQGTVAQNNKQPVD